MEMRYQNLREKFLKFVAFIKKSAYKNWDWAARIDNIYS